MSKVPHIFPEGNWCIMKCRVYYICVWQKELYDVSCCYKCYKLLQYGSTSFLLKWHNFMAWRRTHVILHMTCSNLLMNMLSSCRIICISSFVYKPSVTTYPCYNYPGLPYMFTKAASIRHATRLELGSTYITEHTNTGFYLLCPAHSRKSHDYRLTIASHAQERSVWTGQR